MSRPVHKYVGSFYVWQFKTECGRAIRRDKGLRTDKEDEVTCKQCLYRLTRAHGARERSGP